MLILQKDNVIMELQNQVNWCNWIRFDITLLINGKLRKTCEYLYKKEWLDKEKTCNRFDNIAQFALSNLEIMLNIVSDLWYDIWEKTDIIKFINDELGKINN